MARWSRRRRAALAAGAAVAVTAVLWLAPARARSFGTLAGATVAPDSSPQRTYLVDSVELATTSGRMVSCSLRRPTAAVVTRLPAILVAGGIRTGKRAVLAVDTSFLGLALACDYTWSDPARLPWPAFFLRLPRSRGEIVTTPRVLAIAATYLLSRSEVDSQRFMALGASLGAPPLAAWAAADTRPRAVALLYAGGDLGAVLEHNMRDRVRGGWLRRGVARLLGWVLAPLEPLRTIPHIAPRPLLIIASAEDEKIPARNVELLYATARPPKEIIWLRGAHVLPSEAELLRTLTDSTVAWASRVLPGSGWYAASAR